MRGRLVAVAVIAGLLLGCSRPSERERLVDDLASDFDMDRARAECVADQLYARFSAEEIDALRDADGRDDVPEELLDQLRTALTPCASAGS